MRAPTVSARHLYAEECRATSILTIIYLHSVVCFQRFFFKEREKVS